MPQENSKAQMIEQELQFKKRARRRLVGAIALVLAMMIILPWVVEDRADKSPKEEISISIPSQEAGDFSSKVVPSNPDQQVDKNEVGASPQNTSNSAVETSNAPSNPAKQQEDKTASQPINREADVANKPLSNSQQKIKPETTQKISQSSKKSKQTEEKPANLTALPDGFFVQIGVFTDPDNIRQLQQKLISASLKPHTEKIMTPKGEKTRLRLGPFVSKQEAENTLSKVKQIGLTGMVLSNK